MATCSESHRRLWRLRWPETNFNDSLNSFKFRATQQQHSRVDRLRFNPVKPPGSSVSKRPPPNYCSERCKLPSTLQVPTFVLPLPSSRSDVICVDLGPLGIPHCISPQPETPAAMAGRAHFNIDLKICALDFCTCVLSVDSKNGSKND